MSGSISCGVTTPFSWVLVHTRFCLSPLRVYFPVLCKFWHLYGGVTVTSSRRLMPYRSLLHPEPLPLQSPLLTHTSTGDTQTEFCFSLVGVSGSWCTQGLFEPSDLLWWAWGLILNVISPLLLSCWGFSFALDMGYLFGGIQHSPVDDCSVASCSFGVLTGEDECMSFYFAILKAKPLCLYTHTHIYTCCCC